MDGEVGLADVPLGPFEGTVVTVFAGSSRQTKLHATKRCGYLRSREPAALTLRLDAAVMSRLCPNCGRYGPHVRPGTGADLFFHALCGVGLLYQLGAYTGLDEEEWDREEVTAAAVLLRCDAGDAPQGDGDETASGDPRGDEDQREQEQDDARRLREAVLTDWRGAAHSLHHASAVAAAFPWLQPWAASPLARKQAYLAALSVHAAAFVDAEQLLAAAAAAVMDTPPLPVDDPAFTVLGTQRDVRRALESLWRAWQRHAERGWDRPEERTFLVYDLVRSTRGRRNGEALRAARELVAAWEEQAQHAADAAPAGSRELTVALPAPQKEEHHGYRTGWDNLDRWTLGILVTCPADIDWAAGTARLRVPAIIADRLLAPGSPLASTPASTSYTAGTSPAPKTMTSSPVTPGIFDDTPITDRLPITADHLQALTAAWAGADQLYIVFSAEGGTETLPLQTLQARCARGWQGVILAGANDLPGHLFVSATGTAGPAAEDDPGGHTEEDTRQPARHSRPYDPSHDDFAEHLGIDEGRRQLMSLAGSARETDAALRAWAMARGVHDLRTLGGDDRNARPARTVPYPVWNALLAMDTLNLAPFRAPDDTGRHSGSGIPLAILADVQIYTTNADPLVQGKAHSPACGHARDRGLGPHYDLLTAAQVLARPDIDWCATCGGYAVRRLTAEQLFYYRDAHRLHHLATILAPEQPPTHYTLDTAQLVSALQAAAHRPRCEPTSLRAADRWRWQDIVRPLLVKAKRWDQAGSD